MRQPSSQLAILLVTLGLVALGAVFNSQTRALVNPLLAQLQVVATVADRVREYGPAVHQRLSPFFIKAGVAYPSQQVVLVGLKQERVLEVWAGAAGSPPRFIRSYPVCSASGTLGPKLREGDFQVPEGVYRVTFLNPLSRFHLSLRLDYPNAYDKAKATRDGRHQLGGDIMIHGDCVSIGCLAMGNEAAEDLFVLAAEVGLHNVKVILSPLDLRTKRVPEQILRGLPKWAPELYGNISAELKGLSGGTT